MILSLGIFQPCNCRSVVSGVSILPRAFHHAKAYTCCSQLIALCCTVLTVWIQY